jgi:hypothetical protein
MMHGQKNIKLFTDLFLCILRTKSGVSLKGHYLVYLL